MLTSDLVRVRRRGERIDVRTLNTAERERVLPVAEAFCQHAAAHKGRTRGELEAALDEVTHEPTDYKLVEGLRKLVLDRCTFA